MVGEETRKGRRKREKDVGGESRRGRKDAAERCEGGEKPQGGRCEGEEKTRMGMSRAEEDGKGKVLGGIESEWTTRRGLGNQKINEKLFQNNRLLPIFGVKKSGESCC